MSIVLNFGPSSMLKNTSNSISLLVYSLILILLSLCVVNANGKVLEYYIVFMEDPGVSGEYALRQTHIDVLSALKGSERDAKESLVYSYSKSFNAFAAKLTIDEANKLSGMNGVLNIIKNGYRKLHTTRSWDFIGLTQMARRNLKMERDIIVGLFDTGINPQSESFKDEGLGPPPKKWKGTCLKYANFSGCNNKLIGAQYFNLGGNIDSSDILSPMDVNGHGTHTASTLAGALVPGANLFGLARGTARGAVPSARVAMYKVCWETSGCADMDIFAAFDQAIHDGVDILSISIGGVVGGYTDDSISVGAFRAMRKGIITVASAGNEGPSLGSLSNHAPWLFTVGASGTDRQFRSKIALGNGQNVSGIGMNGFDLKQKYPFVRGGDVAKNSQTKDSAGYCDEDSMDPKKVKGKIIECKLQRWGLDSVIKGLGGIGTVIESAQFLDAAQIYMAPGTMVNYQTALIITNYINSTRSPSGVIYKSEEIKIPAPFIASFSSRGPNPGSKHVLKPDIAAPGVEILAAYTPLKSLTGLKGDTQFSKFTIMSGTSMSCPHIAGVAAYVKSFHPTWSPAAIKSAIMTTASPMSSRVNNEAEFAYGAGQVHPTRALSPGLVYDMDDLSYLQFLCHEGTYTDSQIGNLVGVRSVNCSTLVPGRGEDAVNYPTMQIRLDTAKGQKTGVFRRRVTNVGPPHSVYNATVRAPKGVDISVEPTSLLFNRTLQKRSFKVVVKVKDMPSSKILVSGSLIWRSSRYIVRSPIVVFRNQEG